MTKDQQKGIIEGLCNTLKRSMLKNLDKFPASWDDLEFRQYINDKSRELNPIKMTRSRMWDYKESLERYGL